MDLETANRLAALRRERGLSQEELAAQLGVSRQAVSKWERAESSPDTGNLIALAKLFHISLDELLLHTPGGGAQAPAPQPEEAVLSQEEEIFAAARAWDEAEAAYAEQRRKAFQERKEKLLLPLTVMLMVILPLICLLLRLGNNTYAVVVTILYLVTGFALDNWHPGWMLYLTVPLYYGIWARMV